MMPDLNRNSALDIFLSTLIAHVRDGVYRDLRSLLTQGPPGQKPASDLVGLHEWFQRLSENDRIVVYQVIQAAIDSALFSALVILDGAAGGYPVKGVVSDYALYIQTYKSENEQATDQPATKVRLNPRGMTEDMHDAFQWKIEEHTTTQ